MYATGKVSAKQLSSPDDLGHHLAGPKRAGKTRTRRTEFHQVEHRPHPAELKAQRESQGVASQSEPKTPQQPAGSPGLTENLGQTSFRSAMLLDSQSGGEAAFKLSLGQSLFPVVEPTSLAKPDGGSLGKQGNSPPATTVVPIDAQLTYVPNVNPAIGVASGNVWGDVDLSYNSELTDFGTDNGVFSIVGTIRNDLQIRVKPDDNNSITSEIDTDITSSNYKDVVIDLTPDPATDRSPRSQFWARDLTLQHERFHIYQQQIPSYGPQSVQALQTWLNQQTVSSWDDALNKFTKGMRTELSSKHDELVTSSATEDDAYADGADEYQDRADEIESKGDNDEYA